MKNTISLYAILLSVTLIVVSSLYLQRWEEKETQAPISYDISGYYMFLPAVFIYQDLKKQEFLPKVIEQYKPSPAQNQSYLHPSGNYVMKYSAGMSILMSPAFFIAHGIALVSSYPADGFSPPYQVCLYFYSIIISLYGLFLFRKLMLRHFSDSISAILVIVVGLGTNFFLYGTAEAMYSHNYLFCLGVIVLLHTENWYRSQRLWDIVIVAMAAGMMALSRPTEIIWLMIPFFWNIGSIQDLKNRVMIWLEHWKALLFATCLYASIGFIQLAYYKYATGEWIVYSYKDVYFDWDTPHIWDVLFSYKKGWLVYTPVMSLAVIGILVSWFRREKWSILVTLFFLLNFYIVAAWSEWWYGGGFGQRALIESYSILAFPIGSFLVWFYRSKASKITTWMIVGFCVLLNIFQSYQTQYGPFDTIYMTEAYYWRIFGKVKDEPLDAFLMDMPEDFRGDRHDVRMIYENDFESTTYDSTDVSYSGDKAIFVDKDKEFSEKIIFPIPDISDSDQWLRVRGNFYCTIKEWDTWRIPQMTVLLKSNDKIVKQQMIRVHRTLWYQQWKEVWMDFRVPKGEEYTLEVYLWNANGINNLFLDDLVVELYSEYIYRLNVKNEDFYSTLFTILHFTTNNRK